MHNIHVLIRNVANQKVTVPLWRDWKIELAHYFRGRQCLNQLRSKIKPKKTLPNKKTLKKALPSIFVI
ncbi:MAG: hypothetical protein CL666_11135 [Balneola sp.]|nr:hypothetical protein [Balneola sp.]